MDLFTPIIEEGSLHSNFVQTLDPASAGVRRIIQSWAEGFVDRDGKFVKEFQTTYNSGFWEIYLHAVLKHLRIDVDFTFSSPDFVASNKNIIIEATTANHAHDDVPEWEKTIKGVTTGNLFEISSQSAIRLSNAFDSKVKKYRKNYSTLSHVKGKPFIIGISNFTRQDFNLQGDIAMQWLLYDVLKMRKIFKNNGTAVPLGLFNCESYSDISGVLYSSLATFGKARALSNDAGGFIFKAVRIKDDSQLIPITANKQDYKESLCDGLKLFVNPFAKYPLNIEDFNDPGIRIFISDRNGKISASCHPDGDLCMRFVQRIKSKS